MNDRDYRPTTDASWNVPPLPEWVRVKLTTQAEPKKTFDCIVTYPKAVAPDWDPEDSETADADLWEESTIEIKGVRYGLPSADILEPNTIGWIRYYYGRWCLLIAECA